MHGMGSYMYRKWDKICWASLFWISSNEVFHMKILWCKHLNNNLMQSLYNIHGNIFAVATLETVKMPSKYFTIYGMLRI